ncbi:MAG: hypothetical protein ACKOU6_15750, partial [Planctomycetota bacterium]
LKTQTDHHVGRTSSPSASLSDGLEVHRTSVHRTSVHRTSVHRTSAIVPLRAIFTFITRVVSHNARESFTDLSQVIYVDTG